jgi:hypothetical protein
MDKVKPIRVQLDSIVVVQRDWSDRVMRYFPHTWPILISLLVKTLIRAVLGSTKRQVRGAGGLRNWIRQAWEEDFRRPILLRMTQATLDALHGAPLDSVTRTLGSLRRSAVSVDLEEAPPEGIALLLRGITPEFHRPIRQALREALETEDQIRRFIEALRPSFGICPADLEPKEFTRLAMRDPAAYFLALVYFADNARLTGTLLDAAWEQAPGHPKLARVRAAWLAWDRALCGLGTSDWIGAKQPEEPAAS